MNRLLDGIPLRSDGKLTIVSLAAEAAVKRHLLTHKHTDLRDRLYARVRAHEGVAGNQIAALEQVERLRAVLDKMRAERDEYKRAADALARALNLPTIENDTLRRRPSQHGHVGRPTPLTPVN